MPFWEKRKQNGSKEIRTAFLCEPSNKTETTPNFLHNLCISLLILKPGRAHEKAETLSESKFYNPPHPAL